MHTPDRWAVLKLINDGITIFKILAGWSGGYLDSDWWRTNSGITQIKECGDYYDVYGETGSVYRCHKMGEGFTSLMAAKLDSWERDAKDRENVLIEVVDIKDILVKFKE